MKIQGKRLYGPNVEVVVIPRQNGEIVFKAQAVLDYSAHDKINPMPTAPIRLMPGGARQENVEDPRFLKRQDEWATNKFHWMFLKALQATEGLEWETVDLSNPATWGNYKKEMQDGGLSPGEIARIEMCVADACGLNQAKIDEATSRFLAGQARVLAEPSTPSSEPTSIPSGEPVSVSA